MQHQPIHRTAILVWLGALLAVAALCLLPSGRGLAAPPAQKAKPTPAPRSGSPLAAQVIPGFPLTITLEDLGNMNIQYRDLDNQFFFGDAEGVYLWVNVGGTTKVFGPGRVPFGNETNPYTPVSNVLTGAGTPDNPWSVVTINQVPGTNLLLTQQVSYVNGAEFTALSFRVSQVGGTTPISVTLFHAADLYTGASDNGYGYYDSASGGVGDYYTVTRGVLNGSRLYQEFVPNPGYPAPVAYQEAFYRTIWNQIGSTSGPGTGFNNTIDPVLHDSAVGLQWNLTVPAGGSVIVADTDLFSPHASLCGSFSDVPQGSFYYDYIYYLACHGIVSGYTDTTFRPNNVTTRGQLAKIAANSAGFTETVSGQIFADVPPANGFYPFIQRMATRNLINGYACGSPPAGACDDQRRPYFLWNAAVTRGQLAKIIANARGLNSTPPGQTFADVPPGSAFYLYAERLAALGTISGYACGSPPAGACDGQHRPYFLWANGGTRGQIAKIDKLTFFPTAHIR